MKNSLGSLAGSQRNRGEVGGSVWESKPPAVLEPLDLFDLWASRRRSNR